VPRKQQDRKRPFTDNPNWKGFIRCDLDTRLRGEFDEWEKTVNIQETTFTLLAGCSEGLKFSIAYDFTNGVFVASLAGNNPEHPPTFGWTLTARASTWERAISALYYKHVVVMEEDWRDHMAVRDDDKDNQWVQ